MKFYIVRDYVKNFIKILNAETDQITETNLSKIQAKNLFSLFNETFKVRSRKLQRKQMYTKSNCHNVLPVINYI